MPGPDDRAGLEGELHPLGILARQGLADAQALLRALALGDVVEEDRDLPLGRIPDANGTHVEPAIERVGIALEVRGFPRRGDATVGLEPEALKVRSELGHPFAAQVDPGLPLERRIGFQEAIVHRALALEPHLDDGEGGLDGLQERAEAVLRRAQALAGLVLLGAVAADLDVALVDALLVPQRHQPAGPAGSQIDRT